MTAKDALKRIRQQAKKLGVEVVVTEGKGSHKKIAVGTCQTTIPFHAGETLGKGLRSSVERDLKDCLGEDWLR
jgi:predicted RNA binding protein YcfA (HicA-like mRNA interferase family)